VREKDISPEQEKILIVDDEENILDIIKMMLEHAGYQVITSCNGMTAVEIIENDQDISLVILDLSMPEMSGTETLEKILIVNPEQKVVVSSGFDSGGSVKKALTIGAKCFLQKPVKMMELLKVVRETIDKEYKT